jgi:hypothetical protein
MIGVIVITVDTHFGSAFRFRLYRALIIGSISHNDSLLGRHHKRQHSSMGGCQISNSTSQPLVGTKGTIHLWLRRLSECDAAVNGSLEDRDVASLLMQELRLNAHSCLE